ncbi:hypothetical protein R1flu_029051 [Riccia fluitans]|uniref:Uncharacterized protein n=1 Tax=Riccia fluitans TaxID=41844 RepID=A0ABD1XNE2_9MARC
MMGGEHLVALTVGRILANVLHCEFNEDDGRRAFSCFDSWADTSERAPMLKMDLWLNFEGHGFPEQGNKKKGSDVKGWFLRTINRYIHLQLTLRWEEDVWIWITSNHQSINSLATNVTVGKGEGAAAAELQEELEGDARSTVAADAERGCGPGWGQKRILSSLPKPRHAYRNKYI